MLMGSFVCTLTDPLAQILRLYVPESVVTASHPGDIFVHRNIANQVHPDDDSVLSVLTYAVAAAGIEHSSMPPFHTNKDVYITHTFRD